MRERAEKEAASNGELILQTNDDKEFIIDRKALTHCKVVEELITSLDDDNNELVVPLANVDSETLKLVAPYLEHYKDTTPEVPDKPLRAKLQMLLNEWEKNYIFKELLPDGDEKNNKQLINVLLAANFMGIEQLRDLCCATLANMLRGKTPEQVLEMFGVEEQWSPELEAKGLEQCPWLKETVVTSTD